MTKASDEADVALVVAMAENRVIGHEGRLPWHMPSDLRHFRRLTMGNPIIMGRRTWESLKGPLPGRPNLIVTRQAGYGAAGADVFSSPVQALRAAQRLIAQGQGREVMVIGGAKLYEAFLPLAKRIYLTEIHTRCPGDTWFPRLDPEVWQEVSREDHPAGPKDEAPFSLVVLENRSVPA